MQSKTCSKGGRPCRCSRDVHHGRLGLLSVAGLILLIGLAPALVADSPNIIIILVDDMGYGDLGCFGNPTIRTPNLDRMASEGQKWTSFYAGAIVCTPSRAALITGRHAIRSGLVSDRTWVLPHNAAAGLPDEEITVSEVLRSQGYATGYLGKWHLGHLPRYLPTRHGFDYYYGTPYSNDEKVSDEWKHAFVGKRGWEVSLFYDSRSEYWDIPLIRNEEILERPVDQTRLTKSYTEEAIRFIRLHKKGPFFLYLSHNMPHVPLFSSPQFRGKSLAGPYGDAVEELDWSTGQIVDVLREEGLAQNTLVVFTSDNGPWAAFREHGGSSGLLRDQKGTTWEGGIRVPAIFWWPGRVEPGIVTGIGSAMDLFNTAIALAGGEVPGDRIIDGVDLSPVLLGSGESPRETLLYYRGRRVWAVRKGPFKAHFFSKPEWGHDLVEKQHDPPLLFHLDRDPSERFDISKDHPEVISEIREILRKHQEDLVPGQDLLVKRLPPEK